MEAKVRVVVEPVAEPLSLEEARLHLRLDAEGSPPTHPADDDISVLITVAREHVEAFTGRALAAQTYEARWDEWPDGALELPMPPVIEVETFTYVDADGVVTDVDPSTYVIDLHSEPARIAMLDEADWPTIGTYPGAIRVRFRAGYDTAGSPTTGPAPTRLIQAMKLMIGHWFRNKENTVDKPTYEIPMGARALMDLANRVRRGLA